MQLMHNLAPYANYFNVYPFRDLILACPPFTSNAYNMPFCYTGSANDPTYTVTFDSQGWPNSLTGPHNVYGSQLARLVPQATDTVGSLPCGTYTLQVTGTGWINIAINSLDVNQGTWYQFTGGTVSMPITIAGAAGAMTVPYILITLAESSASDHLRNLRFMMPNPAYATGSSVSTTPYSLTDFSSIWHDTYLAECRAGSPGMPVFRLMDLLYVNFTQVENWADLPSCDANLYPIGKFGYSDYGYAPSDLIPYPVLVNLIQTLNPSADVHWNVPAQATDAFVTSLATYLKANFPNKIYLEYSNEVWNGNFPAYEYAVTQGHAVFGNSAPYDNDYYTNRAYYGYRSKQIADIFRSVFASDSNPSRFRPLLSSEAFPYVWSSYPTTGVSYTTSMAPILIINGYWGSSYYDNAGEVANTIATGESAILAAWGTAGAGDVGGDWAATASYAASIGSTWMIYEGNFDVQFYGASSTNYAYETQSLTVGSATGGTYSLTMPFGLGSSLAMASPYQGLPPLTANLITVGIASNATPNQIRSALLGVGVFSNGSGDAIVISTTNASGVGSASMPGDVITIGFGQTAPGNDDYQSAALTRLPLPLLVVNSSVTGGSAPTVARITAGRYDDNALMTTTLAVAQADASTATLITNIFQYAKAGGCQIFGFYSSTSPTWGDKAYQGEPDSGRPVYSGIKSYLANPSAYPGIAIPPPPVSLTGLAISSPSMSATQSFSGTVTINQAQSTVTTVSISTDHGALFSMLPGSVTIASGQTSAAFAGKVAASIPATTAVAISATISYQTISVEATLMPFNSPYVLNPLDSRCSAVYAAYPCYEGSGTTLHDIGPNGLHMMANDNPSWVAGPYATGAGQFGIRSPAAADPYGGYANFYTGINLPQVAFSYACMLSIDQTGAGSADGNTPRTAIAFLNNEVGTYPPQGLFCKSNTNQILATVASNEYSGTSYYPGNVYPTSSNGLGTTDASWHQYAVGVGATIDYYGDSTPLSNNTIPQTTTAILTGVGLPNWNTLRGFFGSISMLVIFNRTLTGAELARPLTNLIVPAINPTTRKPMPFAWRR